MINNLLQRTHFPYCLQLQEDGSYVITNRDYKPLGFVTDNYIKYDQYPVKVRLKGMTQELIKKLAFDGQPGEDSIYLYNDGCIPGTSEEATQAYFARLALLMKLKIVNE